MKNTLRSGLFLTWFALSMFGCAEQEGFHENMSEGIIEYNVSYPSLDSNNIMLEMLPTKMVMKFKKDRYKSELQTAAGIIEMSVIVDASEYKMYNLVKLFSDKYVLELDRSGARHMTSVLPPFRMEKLDEERVIAEANCNKLLLDFGTAKEESYIFYYTDQIDLKEPNWCTPFDEVQGVLLDYRIENYDMDMRLTAERIISTKIDDKEFEIDESYERLTPKEFEAYVINNLKTFME